MAKCEKRETIVETVVLSMSEEEAVAVRDVLGRVRGNSKKSRRSLTDEVWGSLAVVVPRHDLSRPADLEGTLLFKDSKQKQDAEEVVEVGRCFVDSESL